MEDDTDQTSVNAYNTRDAPRMGEQDGHNSNKDDTGLANRFGIGNGDGKDRARIQVQPSDPSPTKNLDIATQIPDLYRVLDLIYDRGSGGLVDKIIIEQESLGRLINAIQPNAYTSITKVDFSALDRVQVKAVGLYGSMSAIVGFLRQKAIVDEETALGMLQPVDMSVDPTRPSLRSGMYIHLRGGEDVMHVIYWPEDTTWDDNCLSAVSKNRVTFMRYLTKICDQVVCLMSDEHAKAIVWRGNDFDDSDQENDEDAGDGAGRLFAFEVSKTNEQEEGVTVRPGFEIRNSLLSPSHTPNDVSAPLDVLRPRLVRGEMAQGLITAHYVAEQRTERPETDTGISEFRLKDILQKNAIRLSGSLSADALEILFKMKCPFDPAMQNAITRYRSSVSDVKKSSEEKLMKDLNEMVDRVDNDKGRLSASIRGLLMAQVMDKFPSLSQRAAEPKDVPQPPDEDGDLLRNLCLLFEGVARLIEEAPKIDKLNIVAADKYKALKEHILTLGYLFGVDIGLTDQERRELVTTTLRDGYDKPSRSGLRGLFNAPRRARSFVVGAGSASRTIDVPENIFDINDSDFLSHLPDIVGRFPLLNEPAIEVVEQAWRHFSASVNTEAQELSRKIRKVQRDTCKELITRESQTVEKNQLEGLRVEILSVLRSSLESDAASTTMTIEHLEENKHYAFRSTYIIKTVKETFTEPEVRYTLHPLELRQDDAHRMREDPSHIPAPQLRSCSAVSFTLSATTYIVYAHLLPQSRVLLVTRDYMGEGKVYLSSITNLQAALQRKRHSKELKRDKIGENFLLAYDETNRILAVCGEMPNMGRDSRLQLHTFIFDETYASLQGMGTPVNLNPWYDSDGVMLKHMEFVGGIEQLLFVDNLCRARIFSLVTQQFRPATLQLPSRPSSIHSTPDGSCFFAIDEPTEDADVVALRAYHWTSFDSPEGIKVYVPKTVLGGCVVTSLLSRDNVYLVGMDLSGSMLRSVAFKITRRMTAFAFREKDGPKTRHRKDHGTSHNSLIDCHMDIWTRFPVVPAVRRETTVSALRERKSRVFVLNVDPTPVEPHFSTLIGEFKRTTHKPVGDELKNIQVHALSHTTFLRKYPLDLSILRAGEWLVELICLIPIHIAITRDNRFLPLTDGVWSPEIERSLLGADVPKIVDSISFGWYESLFQSYMATKPVRVVSSMGEQSVGKSFALNHLVDTSFAGSAMRTTEGVWMSVTPTEKSLIVALDFEGVHSIERSAQEDSLLVLFNTAISNLVLFRNNFALSRDITGLFQSFQSSASVLDPEANPMLFQSTLVIIIKDVAPHDTEDIKKEFYLKFQQIVEAEQAMNFISRLHRDRVNIVPWPLMGSKQFYTLFKAIKKTLDDQVAHHGGAIFLQTMKTLMAKLKANDWGAMSQTLAAHRAHLLLSLLPTALAFGAAEVIPDYEPLVDFDTASVIDIHDTRSRFYLGETGPQGQPASCDLALQELCYSCKTYGIRVTQADTDWKQHLQTFLDDTVDARAEHVRAWINVNTSKFGSSQSEVQQLLRTFDSAVIDLKASVRLCGAQCASCNLGCILGRQHESSHSCRTNHRCVHMCQFEGANHGNVTPCGLSAGHPGKHLCDITAHLCGQPCKLVGKKGCQDACVKMVDHEDGEHMCSASSHECGVPCSLADVRLFNGRIFSCDGQCQISSDIPHAEHRCDNTQCPIDCQLCKRLCSEHDHLHGLESGTIHLCGQEHACSAMCQAGICKIDTSPQSVEATFTGRHESFQYTKYTQVSKRLPCIIPVPAGQTSHEGKHSHDMGPNPFHHCEERCPDCGYFCTLPLGHTQQEHDTSHGSMSKTRWAIDGGEATVLEVGGRKFGMNDDGAPMLCSMYCRSMGRHAHIDWCRADRPASCSGPEIEHIIAPMQPNPTKAKDWITHGLYWRRTGFKDPYSQEDQANFAKCDRMCSGPEHDPATHPRAQLSYCTLPMLHRRQTLDLVPANGLGYVSNDGHTFECRNPAVMHQAFHVIFAIDRSGSMNGTDQRALDNTPSSQLIRRSHDNRLGAVYSSLNGFWEARHRTVTVGGGTARRDAYTVIFFNHVIVNSITHDFNSSPTELLNAMLRYRAEGGTNFTLAIQAAQSSLEKHWSTERTPVIIFLSDGECGIADETMQNLCRRSIARGKPVSFHTISFGPQAGNLQRMAQIARDVENGVPPDPLNPHARVPSSYHRALDTVQLAETFLGLADSLAKPRGALFRG